ncbi:MAG TPA: ATP-binding protein, partial [Microbacterium sp.]|nr:ATP-binding protein [Microbacterium sp.]
VVTISVLVLIVQPALFGQWQFTVGMTALIVLTIATMVTPWSQLPRSAVLVIPFLDALAIGLAATSTDLRFGFLWVFPVMWVAMHFRAAVMAALLAVIGIILLVDSLAIAGSSATLRFIITLFSLTFIGITAHLAMRQTRALRRLMTRQAGRLNTTAERRADDERRTNEILNGVDSGVARISATGAVLAVNDAYVRLYGLDPLDPSLPARSVEYSGLRAMPVPALDRAFARAARGETFTNEQVWIFTPDGEWRALSASAKRLRGSGNEEGSILLVVHDVTATAQAELDRERLDAVTSHELMHPLSVLIGNAELSLDLDELTPKTRERIETMLRASDRLLEMAKLITSPRSLDARHAAFDEVDLRDIVADSVASFRPTALVHEVSIETVTPRELPILADGFRLRQVVDNLVSNAIKYTPAGGDVRIMTALDNDTVSLTVADSGIGVSKEELPRLLDPYFRTSAAKQKASGTGLGLVITNEIIAAHSGTLAIDSEAGVGTTVTVTLPSVPPHALFEISGGVAK